MNETMIRKGTNMKTITLALLGLVCLLALPNVAHARYRDGMNLYQYVRSNPTKYVDWVGAQATQPGIPAVGVVDGNTDVNGTTYDSKVVVVEAPDGEFELGGKKYDAVLEIVPGLTNCAGYACGVDGSWRPANTPKSKASVMQAIKVLGFECTRGISAKDCKKHCDCADWIEVYVYTHPGDDIEKRKKQFAGKDFLNDPWKVFNADLDFHVIKGKGDAYTFQMQLAKKAELKPEEFTPTDARPDFFGPGQFLDKACCCRGPKNKPAPK